MDDAGISIVRRFDNPATGLLVGLLALIGEATAFALAADVGLGTAPVAVAGSVAAGFVLTLLLWSRGARWSAAWVAATSSVWAYLAVLLATTGMFWPARF
jgi:hypothetical protein